ncbi:MAG: c-type cytochrome [Nitrospirota bacterium]|nr:c-type cytochrome [Nitrospirota bacterium]
MRYRSIILATLSALFVAASVLSADAQPSGNPSVSGGEKLYQQYCTPCHGVKGDGNGFNAGNLDPRPTNHSDAVLMSKKSDRELNDAISGGGRAVGKATLMPPWGNTFSKDQIVSIVLYLRKLCGCREL